MGVGSQYDKIVKIKYVTYSYYTRFKNYKTISLFPCLLINRCRISSGSITFANLFSILNINRLLKRR